MRTTAEGVVTHDELLLVTKLGCSLVQRYIFGKPMPAREAMEVAVKGAASLPAQLPPRERRIRIIRVRVPCQRIGRGADDATCADLVTGAIPKYLFGDLIEG